MDYIEENGKIYKVVTTKTEIDLDALKEELADLKAMEAPDDKELVEHGKMMHPYYMDREMRIPDLERQISEIEKDIKVIAVEK